MTPTIPAPGAVPTLARPDLQPDRRPGGGRRDAAQRRPDRPRRARAPVRRAARHRQDLARPDPRQGRQLHEPPGRRSVRRVRRVRRHPRGHDPRRPRDRRRLQPRHQRGPRPARAAGLPARPPAAQGLHPRRGPPDHQDAWNALLKSLEEPPDFVVFMFASTEPSGFPPAILSRLQRYDVRRLTVPEIEGKLRADPRGRWPDGRARRAHTSSPGWPPAACATPSRSSTSSCPRAATRSPRPRVRDLLGLADAAAVDGFVDALLTGDAAAGHRDPRRARGARPRPAGAARPGRRRASAPGSSPRPDRRPPTRTGALADVARRLVAIDPTAPASAACASSSSSPCSPRRPAHRRPRRRADDRRDRPPPEPGCRPRPRPQRRPPRAARAGAGRPQPTDPTPARVARAEPAPAPRRPSRRRGAVAGRTGRRQRAAAPPEPQPPRRRPTPPTPPAAAAAPSHAAVTGRRRRPGRPTPTLDRLVAAGRTIVAPLSRQPADQAAHPRPAGRSPSTASS